MKEKTTLERLKAYEELIAEARKKKEKQEEENSRSILGMLRAHERALGAGGGCSR